MARRVRLSRRQRALVGQWQAYGALTLFLGLTMGILVSLGAPAPAVVGGGLVLSAIVLAPLGLMSLSARVERYRLAAAFGMLGVLCNMALLLLGLVGPYDGYPLLEQIARVLMCYAATGVLASAAIATFGSARALWEAGISPPRLGPSVPEPEALVNGTRAIPEQTEEFWRQFHTLQLGFSTR